MEKVRRQREKMQPVGLKPAIPCRIEFLELGAAGWCDYTPVQLRVTGLGAPKRFFATWSPFANGLGMSWLGDLAGFLRVLRLDRLRSKFAAWASCSSKRHNVKFRLGGETRWDR